MQIAPVDGKWIHEYLVQPCLYGCELINLAWRGIDDWQLQPKVLSLKTRVISWLQGLPLLILPLINSVIHLFWQTFGNPKPLPDPYDPELPLQEVARKASPLPSIPSKNYIKPIEKFCFTETSDRVIFAEFKDQTLETEWTVEHYPHQITVQQKCGPYRSTANYRPDLTLKDFEYTMGEKHCHMWQLEGDRKHIDFLLKQSNGEVIEKILAIPEDLPLIQQRVGFRPFVQSKQESLSFYSIIPEIPLLNWIPCIEKPPFLIKNTARKLGLEEVPGYGKLLKIEVVPDRGWPYNLAKSEMWFDPKNGKLKRFIDSAPFMKREGVLQKNP